MVIMHNCLKLLNIKYACQSYSVESVSKIKSILLVMFYAIHVAVCYQFYPFLFDDYKNICTSSYYHHQIGNMNR